MNPEQSYRKRYHESATYRRAMRREARKAWRAKAALALYAIIIIGGAAWIAAQAFGS